jgi:predicted solute-binding protein
MPYKMRKVSNKNCYRVSKKTGTKRVFAKCTSRKNAISQMRLLRALEHNKDFVPNASMRRKTMKKRSK